MRILHLPVAFGRQAWGLSQAEKRAGHSGKVVVYEDTPYRLNADEILFNTGDGVLKQEFKRWKFFLSNLFKYDVFHFHFGQKFFVLFPRPVKQGDSAAQAALRLTYWVYSSVVGKFDIFLLRLLGKKIFMTYHGDDIRQGDRSRERYEFSIAQEVGPDYYDSYTDNRKRRMGEYYRRVCDQVYVVSPDLLAMAPVGAKLIHYTGVHPNEWTLVPTSEKSKITIAHAPTHRLAKGTRFIENAVAALKARGLDFDFVTIENLPNDQARKIYEKADVIVDQLLAGWYGVFAIELMAMGKPVIAYIRDEDLAQEPKEFQRDFPIIRASPKSIESVLEDVICGATNLRERGLQSRKFVECWYDPDQIAATVVGDYKS